MKGDIAAQCFEASKADEINEFSPSNKKGIKKDQGKRGKILKFKLSKTYIEFWVAFEIWTNFKLKARFCECKYVYKLWEEKNSPTII